MNPEKVSKLPSNFNSKVSYLRNYSKAPIRILPQTSSPLKNNQILKIVLPVGQVLDLSTFAIHFNFVAKQNNADVAAGNLVGMPKNCNIFEAFECFVNGRSVQNIQSYHRIYSILKDFKSNHNSQLRKLSNNADPSVYETLDPATGVIAKINTKNAPAGAVNFTGRYVIDDFIGFLKCQPNIVDTNLTGNIELSFRIAGPEVLFKTDGGDRNAVSFEISDVVCYCDTIYFKDDNYYSGIRAAMQAEDGFKLVYDNFGVYTGNQIAAAAGASKNATVKCTENCKSLDYILWTYFDTTSTGLQSLQLGNAAPAATEAEHFGGQIPASRYNYDNLLALRDTALLNNSVFFRRNGVADNLKVEFSINSQPVTVPMTLQEQWEETLKCFDIHNDSDNSQINPSIHSMPVFQKDFYVCGLSLSHIGNKNPNLLPLISGLDSRATSMNIVVSSTESGAAAVHGSCQPYVITKFTSMLHITGERNVMPSR